jgi:hypothetical protein
MRLYCPVDPLGAGVGLILGLVGVLVGSFEAVGLKEVRNDGIPEGNSDGEDGADEGDSEGTDGVYVGGITGAAVGAIWLDHARLLITRQT